MTETVIFTMILYRQTIEGLGKNETRVISHSTTLTLWNKVMVFRQNTFYTYTDSSRG